MDEYLRVMIDEINARRNWDVILGQKSGLSTAQHRERLIGASDIPAIMGVSPMNYRKRRGPLDVYLDFYGLREREPMTEAQQEGVIKEAYLANMYRHRTGLPLVEMSEAIVNPGIPYLTAHIDRGVKGTKLPVELKNVGWRMRDHWEDGVPVYVLAQVYGQMIAWDTDHAAVGADIETRGYEIFPVDMQVDIRDMVLDAVHEFWNKYIVPMKPPPVDASATAKAFLLKQYPDAGSFVEEATAEEALLLREMDAATAEKKAAEERVDRLANRLREAINDRKGIEILDENIRAQWYNVNASVRVDWQAVVEDLVGEDLVRREDVQEAATNHTKVSPPNRAFRFLSKSKEKE